jgi:hypothetical protein
MLTVVSSCKCPICAAGLSFPHRAAATPTAALAAVVLLGCLACLFVLSGPLFTWAPSRTAQRNPLQLWDLELDAPKRALLAADFSPDSAQALSTSEIVFEAARGMLPAAEFVCNRTSCVALKPKGVAEAAEPAPQPLELREPTRSGQEELGVTMISALKELPRLLCKCVAPRMLRPHEARMLHPHVARILRRSL